MSEKNSYRKSVYRSKRTGQEKIRVDILLSYSTWARLTEFAPKFFGTHRGAISYAVEESLRHWLALYMSGGNRMNPHQGIREYYNAVMNEVKKHFDLLIPSAVSHDILLKCVMKALNVKDRSAQSWLYRFYAEELIKPLAPPGIELKKPADVRWVKVWEIVAKEA